MKESRFRDNFWSTDLTSTVGYDNLVQHMNDGRKTCKELEEFIKQSTLKRAFDVFKQQMENVGLSHIQLASSLREEIRKLDEFREKQKDQRKKIEHCMENLHKQKTMIYKKTMDSKKTYEQKCKEKDEAEQTLNRSAGVSNSKQQEKLQAKANQSKQSSEDADRQYQQNVSNMGKIQEEWQMEHIRTCERIPEARTKELKPFIILIKPPSISRLQQTRARSRIITEYYVNRSFKEEDLQEMQDVSGKILDYFGHLFDSVIVNDELQDTCLQLLSVVKEAQAGSHWVPAAWLNLNTSS